MSLEQLKKEAEALTKDERRELMSHMVRLIQDQQRARELAEIIDDKDPSHWIPLSEVKARYPASE
jgi:hypothetical protein